MHYSFLYSQLKQSSVDEENRSADGLVTVTFEDFQSDEGSPITLSKAIFDIVCPSSREKFGKNY